MRIDKITEQTKLTESLNKVEASGVSRFLDEKLSLASSAAGGSCAVSDEAIKGGSMLSYALES